MDVEFVYDYRSPYAYLADTQLSTLGARIVYKLVEILSVRKAGNTSPPRSAPQSSAIPLWTLPAVFLPWKRGVIFRCP